MFVDRDSCKSALSWIYMLFYITQSVLMAAFAPAIIPAGLVSNLSRFHFLGQICQPFSWWLVFSTSYPRLNPLGLEVVAMVISSWWFHLGDFALVISTSINIIDHPLKNSPCFSKVFIWHFAFHATCILFLSFLTIVSFLTTTSLCTIGSWSIEWLLIGV